jgi:hypothetical protein|tara:strand:+ start:8671 stop:8835 length:165 start_codon:yes stop_codon:yes gene_type:complete
MHLLCWEITNDNFFLSLQISFQFKRETDRYPLKLEPRVGKAVSEGELEKKLISS